MGNYVVQFDPSCVGDRSETGLAGQYYSGSPGGSPTYSGAMVLQVAGDLTDIDAALAPGAGFSGQVTYQGAGVQGVCVDASDASDFWYYTTKTDSDGNYQINGMTLAPYNILFDPVCAGATVSPYAPQYYTAVYDPTSAVVTPGVDAAVSQSAGITGLVTGPGPSNPPLGKVCVYLSPPQGAPYSFTVSIHLRHERRRRSHVGCLSDAVLCERWETDGLSAPAYGGGRQTTLCCVG